MRDRTWLEARRAASQDSTRSTDRLAVASVLVGAVLAAVTLFVRILLLPMPPPPDLNQVLNANGGQPPPHVQSGFVQR